MSRLSLGTLSSLSNLNLNFTKQQPSGVLYNSVTNDRF